MMDNKFYEARMAKFNYVKEQENPYPERFEITHSLKEASILSDGIQQVKVAGRIMTMRKMGKLSFVTLADVEGRIQIALKKDSLGEDTYGYFKKAFDIGDFMGIEGEFLQHMQGRRPFERQRYSFWEKHSDHCLKNSTVSMTWKYVKGNGIWTYVCMMKRKTDS
jgi:lysyl-tRNA synthetase class 2